jgi:hypothetical protein
MTIVHAAILAAAFLSSGCIIVDDGIDAGDPLNAEFSLTWATVDSVTGMEVNCVWAGANTVRTTATNVTTGDEFVDLFDCRDNGGSTYPVTAGRYWVGVDLLWCGDSACTAPVAIAPGYTAGRYSVFRDGDVNIGHFIFLVDR